jgi:hypothetical protein
VLPIRGDGGLERAEAEPLRKVAHLAAGGDVPGAEAVAAGGSQPLTAVRERERIDEAAVPEARRTNAGDGLLGERVAELVGARLRRLGGASGVRHGSLRRIEETTRQGNRADCARGQGKKGRQEDGAEARASHGCQPGLGQCAGVCRHGAGGPAGRER